MALHLEWLTEFCQKGSKYNVQVEWETGEITFEPLSIIAADDPVTCAAYAKENDLLALEGCRRFRSLDMKDKVLTKAIKQSRIRQVRRSQSDMFGYLIPRNYMEAMQFDSENKNSKWHDAIKLEMESMSEYKVFKKWDKAIHDKHMKVKNPPKGYLTEVRQPLQVQSHLEMPGILVQLGHIQHT